MIVPSQHSRSRGSSIVTGRHVNVARACFTIHHAAFTYHPRSGRHCSKGLVSNHVYFSGIASGIWRARAR